jgi:hypothetical protein
MNGWPVGIEWREAAGLHELTSAGSNDADDEESRLPAPGQLLLTRHDVHSLEIEIGD